MNEKRFRLKEQKLIEYEEKIHQNVLEFLKPYNEELAEKGVEIECSKMWIYPNQISDDESYKQRKPITKKKTYICSLIVRFKHIEDDDEDGEGLYIGWDITEYHCYTLNFWIFEKYRITGLLKRIDKEVQQIKMYGFESELKKGAAIAKDFTKYDWKYELTLRSSFRYMPFQRIKEFEIKCSDRINLQKGIMEICNVLNKKYIVIGIEHTAKLNAILKEKSINELQNKNTVYHILEDMDFFVKHDWSIVPSIEVFTIETLPRDTKDFTKQISCRAFSIELDDYLWQNNLKIDKRQYSRDIIEDLKNRYGKKNVQKQIKEKAI